MENQEKTAKPPSQSLNTPPRILNKALAILLPLCIATLSYFMSTHNPELVSDMSGCASQALASLKSHLSPSTHTQETYSDTETKKASEDLVVASLEEGATRGNFRLVKRININYTDAVITQWISTKTGLKVVHVDYQGALTYPAWPLRFRMSDRRDSQGLLSTATLQSLQKVSLRRRIRV